MAQSLLCQSVKSMTLLARDVVLAIPGFYQPVSSLSHLLAAGVALVAAVPLLRLARGSTSRFWTVAVYAFCLVATLTISGTYHALQRGGSARAVMQRIDYVGIWLLIGGTLTAIHGVLCRGAWRSRTLAFVWIYALCGVMLQVYRFAFFYGLRGLMLYLGLGAVGVVSIIKLRRQLGARAVRPLWMAGIAYVAGAVLEATGHPSLIRLWVGPHEVFHIAVILGMVLHWVFIRRMLLVYAPRPTTGLGTHQSSVPYAAVVT
jgi:channel protein (hemolysin III family)